MGRRAKHAAGEDAANNKKHRTIAILLIIIIIILLMLLLRSCTASVPVLNPDFPPVEDDPNAEALGGDEEKLDHEEGGGAVSIELHDEFTIDLSEGKAHLYFANPNRSTQDMMVEVVIQDQVIIQSGRLRPDHKVTSLDLLKNAEKKLTAGVYKGKIVVYYYDPVNNERAMVNTEVPVTITVQE